VFGGQISERLDSTGLTDLAGFVWVREDGSLSDGAENKAVRLEMAGLRRRVATDAA
jgi:hypothetical protein